MVCVPLQAGGVDEAARGQEHEFQERAEAEEAMAEGEEEGEGEGGAANEDGTATADPGDGREPRVGSPPSPLQLRRDAVRSPHKERRGSVRTGAETAGGNTSSSGK